MVVYSHACDNGKGRVRVPSFCLLGKPMRQHEPYSPAAAWLRLASAEGEYLQPSHKHSCALACAFLDWRKQWTGESNRPCARALPRVRAGEKSGAQAKSDTFNFVKIVLDCDFFFCSFALNFKTIICMTRTYDLVELKTRSILTCIVSEGGFDLLHLQASFEGTVLVRVSCDTVYATRVSFALIADEQRRFMSNLQSMLFGHLTIEDLKALSRKINFPNCDELLF